jgi:hypothetical protein
MTMSHFAAHAPTVAPPVQHKGAAILHSRAGDPVPEIEGVFAVLISPSLAADWLARYSDPAKRKVRDARVIEYAKDIAAGRWVWGTSTITFTLNGKVELSNGHHRLTAISRGSKSVWMLVVTGADPESRSVTDTGLLRTTADVIRMDGAKDYTNEIASHVKMYLLYSQTVGTDITWRGPKNVTLPTKREQHDAWKSDADLWRSIAHAVKGGAKYIPVGIPPKSVGTFVYLAESKHPGAGIDFFHRFAAARMPDLTNAMTVAGRSRPTGSGTQLEFDRWVIECLIRAFNAEKAGTTWHKPQRTGTPFRLSRVR